MATVERTAIEPAEETHLLDLSRIEFRYEPFPMGFATNLVSADFYEQLLSSWPSDRLFAYKPALGNKYSLSLVNNPELYQGFVAQSPAWRRFQQLVDSPAFIDYVLECLRGYNIDLGYSAEQLSSRFEFSMLSGNGGHIIPQTDAPHKVITLELYLTRPGEWNPAYGGGTSALKPKDVRKTFNDLNINVGFNEVECLYTYPFVPNACVVFVKTFNSYHAVYPILGREESPRRSVTINIERPQEPRITYLQQRRPHFRLG